MDSFDVYKIYLALKLHFTNKNYDVVKYNGKVKASEKSFLKRNDGIFFKKLAKKYSREEIVDYFIATFIVSGSTIHLSNEADRRYEEWKTRKSKREYLFERDIAKIILEMEKREVSNPFVEKNLQHPLTFQLYYANMINIETMVITDKIFNFVDIDTSDVFLSQSSLTIKKYRPFVKVTDNMLSVAKDLEGCINRSVLDGQQEKVSISV